jgi:hypothetical protein
VLSSLRDTTERLASIYREVMPSLSANVVWGMGERFVYVGSFQFDKEHDPIEGKGHASLCKPTFDYLFPLDFVAYGTSKTSTAF